MYIGPWQEYNLSKLNKKSSWKSKNKDSEIKNALSKALDPDTVKKTMEILHPIINDESSQSKRVVDNGYITRNFDLNGKGKLLKLPSLLNRSHTVPLSNHKNVNDTRRVFTSETFNMVQSRPLKSLRRRDAQNSVAQSSLRNKSSTHVRKLPMKQPLPLLVHPNKKNANINNNDKNVNEDKIKLVEARRLLYMNKQYDHMSDFKDQSNSSSDSSSKSIPPLPPTKEYNQSLLNIISEPISTMNSSTESTTRVVTDTMIISSTPIIQDINLDKNILSTISKYFNAITISDDNNNNNNVSSGGGGGGSDDDNNNYADKDKDEDENGRVLEENDEDEDDEFNDDIQDEYTDENDANRGDNIAHTHLNDYKSIENLSRNTFGNTEHFTKSTYMTNLYTSNNIQLSYQPSTGLNINNRNQGNTDIYTSNNANNGMDNLLLWSQSLDFP